MGKAGEDAVALTSADDDDASRQASWSSDGKQLAYSSRKNGDFDIWIMDSDGSSKVRVTRLQGDEGKPVWSPDGQTIAFVCSDCLGAVGSDLYVISKASTGR